MSTRERNQDLAPRPSTTSTAAPAPPSTFATSPTGSPAIGLHRAAHQLMLVIGTRLQGLQRLFRDPQLESREPLDVLDRAKPSNPITGRPFCTRADVDRQRLVARAPIASRTSRPPRIAPRRSRSRD